MNVPEHCTPPNILQQGKEGCPLIFFQFKIFSRPLGSTEDVKLHYEQRFTFAKKIPALVNLCVTNMNGKHY
jgi:hypothetical protein